MAQNSNDIYIEVLSDLIEKWEDEVVEFKEAKGQFDSDKLGRYFSAISNESNLHNQQFGWLVFGVRENDHVIVGSHYKEGSSLNKLKAEIGTSTTGKTSFLDIIEIYPLNEEGKPQRVIMFKIPATPIGIPMEWKGRAYGRKGDTTDLLPQAEIDIIRNQKGKDWSRQLVPGGSIRDLEPNALLLAREKYKSRKKDQLISEEVDQLSDEAFLNKIQLMRDGQLTYAALVLLGKADSKHLIERPPSIMWRVHGGNEDILDYKIIDFPFITAAERVYQRIRNLTFRYMPDKTTLFPMEISKYDQSILYEILDNCIAHQDYSMGARIYVDEFEDQIVFSNPGSFIPGDIRTVLQPGYTPPYYRNQLLADSMMNFNMIDTASMGILKVYKILRNRYFPMPNYDIENNQVKVTIFGKLFDTRYTQILFERPDLNLDTVYLMDKIQKHEKISHEDIIRLRKAGLIEGRSPNIYLSSSVSEIIDERESYIKNRGFSDKYYQDLIADYIKEFGKANRKSINKLLYDKLPDTLTDDQKKNKIKNLLYKLKKRGIIVPDSPNSQKCYWILNKQDDQCD